MVSNKSFVIPTVSVDVFSRLIGNYMIFDFDFFWVNVFDMYSVVDGKKNYNGKKYKNVNPFL